MTSLSTPMALRIPAMATGRARPPPSSILTARAEPSARPATTTLSAPDFTSDPGTARASALGLLAVGSRQTAADGLPGPGIGLIVGWLTVIVLTFHWARVVWTRTAVQMAAEAERRREAAEASSASLLDGLESHGLQPPGDAQPPSDAQPPGDAQPPSDAQPPRDPDAGVR